MEYSIPSILPAMEWVPTHLISPHPKNPRFIDRSERFTAIVESMKLYGFWQDKPLVVRPIPGGLESVGGSTRLSAAIAAGIDRVFCSIQSMTDDEAIVRLAEDNLGDPFNWLEMCVYIAENAVKDSKTGLSRSRLVQACTGKTGEAAEKAATHQGRSGELITQLMAEQSSHVGGLLLSKKDLTRHLYEICVLPDYTDREYLVGRLLTENLTIEQIRSTVDAVRRSRLDPPTFDHGFSGAIENHAPSFPPLTAHPLPQVQRVEASAADEMEYVMDEPIALPALQIVPDLKPLKPAKPEYDPTQILTLELNAANDRVEKLEVLIYDLFNTLGQQIPQAIADRAIRMGVFAFRHQEIRNAG